VVELIINKPKQKITDERTGQRLCFIIECTMQIYLNYLSLRPL